jgi:hypothetical protein
MENTYKQNKFELLKEPKKKKIGDANNNFSLNDFGLEVFLPYSNKTSTKFFKLQHQNYHTRFHIQQISLSLSSYSSSSNSSLNLSSKSNKNNNVSKVINIHKNILS